MRRASSSSSGATYLDKSERIETLREAARRAAQRSPEIRRVVLFGSLVAGIPTPRSDADLLVVVESSAESEPRDRIPAVLAALSPLPCPVDLFVWTVEELEQARDAGSPLARVMLSTGVDLL